MIYLNIYSTGRGQAVTRYSCTAYIMIFSERETVLHHTCNGILFSPAWTLKEKLWTFLGECYLFTSDNGVLFQKAMPTAYKKYHHIINELKCTLMTNLIS